MSYFSSLILGLMLLWMQFFWIVRDHYNGLREAKEHAQAMDRKLKEEKLKLSLLDERFFDFKQSVAMVMPKALSVAGESKDAYPLRNLASVLSSTAKEPIKNIISKALFEQGQKFFREKKFVDSNRIFKKFIDNYSYSIRTPEAYFLWLDGAFQMGDYAQCVELSKQMVELFPGTELTGFALLRLAKVYEQQGRADDAVDIYKTVIRSYPQRDLTAQARQLLKGVDL